MGCGASGDLVTVESTTLPRAAAASAPTNGAAALGAGAGLHEARVSAMEAIEQLLATVRAAGPEVDMAVVVAHVQQAQAAAAGTGGKSDDGAKASRRRSQEAPTSEQIVQFAHELQSSADKPQSKATAFIERFAVSRILKGATFVGHINTDLDSIAGAIGAANLYDGTAAKAQAELNGEIVYALDFAGLPQPALFDDLGEAARSRVCLVDHNEEKQMVQALRDDPDRASRIVGAFLGLLSAISFDAFLFLRQLL